MKKDTHDKLSRRMTMNMISTGPLVWIDLYWFGLILYGFVKKIRGSQGVWLGTMG